MFTLENLRVLIGIIVYEITIYLPYKVQSLTKNCKTNSNLGSLTIWNPIFVKHLINFFTKVFLCHLYATDYSKTNDPALFGQKMKLLLITIIVWSKDNKGHSNHVTVISLFSSLNHEISIILSLNRHIISLNSRWSWSSDKWNAIYFINSLFSSGSLRSNLSIIFNICIVD